MAVQVGHITGAGDIRCADSADVSVTGDIDIRFWLDATDWFSSSTDVEAYFAWKWDGGTQKSWVTGTKFDIGGTGADVLLLYWSADGSANKVLYGTVDWGAILSDGVGRWVRYTLDVDNGSSQHVFETYDGGGDFDAGPTWVKKDSVTGSGTTSIYDGTDPIRLTTLVSANVDVKHFTLRDGIAGTVVAEFEPSSDPWTYSELTGTHTDSYGESWSITSPAVMDATVSASTVSAPAAVGTASPLIVVSPASVAAVAAIPAPVFAGQVAISEFSLLANERTRLDQQANERSRLDGLAAQRSRLSLSSD